MAQKGVEKWIATLAILIGVLLQMIDSTVVNVAMANIIGSLGATVADASWVTTGYMLASVIILPISGWLGNRLGRKKYFLISTIAFTVMSFFCGNAHSLVELIIYRLLQGLAGGGLMSTGQAILLDTWPKEDHGMAMAFFGIGLMVGPAIGPILGGYIVDNMSWQWIFYVNLPIGVVAAFLISTFVKESEIHGKGEPVDWAGIAFLAIGASALQVVLEKGQTEDWFQTPYIVALSAISIIALICFVWRELVTKHPIMNLSIFRRQSFLLGTIQMFLIGLIFSCSMFALPLFCQTVLHLSAQATGALLIPSAVVSMFLMPVVGGLMKRGVSNQLLGVIGMVLFLLPFVMMSGATSETGAGFFVWPMIIFGIGRSFLFIPFTTMSMQDLKGREVGEGTGIINLMRQFGGSFGIAIFATWLPVQIAGYRNILIENAAQFNPAFQERFQAYTAGFAAKGFNIDLARSMSLKAVESAIMTQAQLLAYNHIYAITVIMLLACIPLFLMQKSKKNAVAQSSDH
jgi:MFS transporter, DHA2 family, multidrug resistance protein